MPTIEERLVAYAHELDTAADHADADRESSRRVGAPSRDRSGMRGWKSVSVAAVTVVVVGTGLWAINNRDGASSTAPNPRGPATVPSSDTALAGEASPWYRITAAGLAAKPVEQETCCATFDVPGPPTVVSWQAAGGPRDGLLVLTVYPSAEAAAGNSEADATLLPQADGSVWQFWSYGMTTERREALAALVVPGSGLPYVLPDPSMSLLSVGGLGPAAHARTQAYFSSENEHPESNGINFATMSVGSDRGLFRELTLSKSLTYTTVAGMPAYRSEQSGGVVLFDWRATAGQWATLVVSGDLAGRADEIAASVVPDQSELLPPGLAPGSSGPTAESATFAQEQADVMAALGWQVTLREHASRTTSEGIEVNWAYFSEPGRRLFIVSGPTNLLASVPDLQRNLTSNPDPASGATIWIWPQEKWLTTEAVTTGDRTLIFRSEGIDTTDAARSRADMDALVQAAIASLP
jgi:hypothetical protein